MGVIWHAWCLHFGVLGDSWDAPGTILGRSWDIGGHKEGPLRSRLGFYRFLVDLGDPFREIIWSIWTEKHDFFIFISRLLFLLIFRSESGFLGLENQVFGKGGISKINFCRNWISNDSRVDFSGFWVALGPIFMILVGLETGLKFDDFSKWFWVHPRSCDHPGWGYLVPGP